MLIYQSRSCKSASSSYRFSFSEKYNVLSSLGITEFSASMFDDVLRATKVKSSYLPRQNTCVITFENGLKATFSTNDIESLEVEFKDNRFRFRMSLNPFAYHLDDVTEIQQVFRILIRKFSALFCSIISPWE